MFLDWLKHYVPRGLYGRALLILILPMTVMQIVVSVVFIQRHFEDVTTQMTRTVERELRLVLGALERAPDAAQALVDAAPLAGPLALDLRFVDQSAVPAGDALRWYDLSGRVMRRVLRAALPQIGPVDLSDGDRVALFVATGHGPLAIGFERQRVSASNPHQLLVNMVFFSALVTLVAYLYLRNQLRPITRLADAAQAFGRGRHVRYTPGGALEVRGAGHAFVEMRARIERHIEQRTMMLSGVSHDLRTPLTRLKLGLEMLDDADAVALRGDVDEMRQMLDAFLDFAKGDAEGEAEAVNPVALARQAVADARRAGRAVTLGDVTVAGPAEVMLRPGAMSRALGNLIGNAVRYGSHAVVEVRLSPQSLRFRVEDDGPGIAPEQRAQAVRPFVRLDQARNQNRGGGVGLGLAIASDIARAHGGVLRLGQSEALGGLRADIVIAR